MEQSWNSYINSLTQNFLPRQVEVTEGNYFSGKFQLIADPVPFETVADLVHSVHVTQCSTTHRSPLCFQNLIPISTAESPMVLEEREKLSLIGLEESQGKRFLRCEVLGKKPPLRLLLPMDCRGQFQECQEDQLHTVDTIIRSKLLAGRQRKIRAAAGHCLRSLSPLVPEDFSGHLILHPYFSVMAFLPGEVQVAIPSDLDIYVTDITDLGNRSFKTMTMKQIYSIEKSKFPLRIKIMSVTLAQNRTGRSKTFPLKCGQLLTILRTQEVKKFIAAEIFKGKKRRHFLIPYTYQGMVLRKGRYFNSVSDVAIAMHSGQLRFQSSKDYTSNTEPCASFTAKECFLALKKDVVSADIQGEMHRVEVLKCHNITTNTPVKLPLFAEGDFLELADDAGPGTLQELCKIKSLPCHIKVISPDPSMVRDPLYETEELRIENVITEQSLIAKDGTWSEDIYSSFSEDIYSSLSEDTFEIPVEKINSEVLIVEECPWLRDLRKETNVAVQNIEEISEAESLTFSNYMIAPHPPPCPPKPRSLS
ncbi:Protein THEMIS3 [Tupaia chinensis]|uniref:Protein THEMIS3 n=1 Tax=Tupaia chinensis TaxID=246437 RepID=L8YCP8_TUPCH|nr:Protein THEMIS3 [Tupaia chinensis]